MMTQNDLREFADHYMNTCLQVHAGENVWIEHEGPRGLPLARMCAAAVEAKGGIPCLRNSGHNKINTLVENHSEPGELETIGNDLLLDMQTMQAYIRIVDFQDQAQIDVDMDAYNLAMRPMKDQRVKHTRWVVVGAPDRDAYATEMSADEFGEFYRNVSLMDYSVMAEAAQPLIKLIDETKIVRLVGDETDITFSIEGMGAVLCAGDRNIPDGEVYTAPVRESVNGTVKYGPSIYNGQEFPWIKFTVENGKIIQAETEPKLTGKLNKILDTDEGARYFGEFAIAFNPFINDPMKNILFDEKIAGSFHFTPGNAYKDGPADNGNRSAVHWDLVQIQRPAFGGGEIWFDGRLIRKDGIFTLPELEGLNPANLIAACKQVNPGFRGEKLAPR